MTRCVLALDQGTTSSRAILFDDGAILGHRRERPYIGTVHARALTDDHGAHDAGAADLGAAFYHHPAYKLGLSIQGSELARFEAFQHHPVDLEHV